MKSVHIHVNVWSHAGVAVCVGCAVLLKEGSCLWVGFESFLFYSIFYLVVSVSVV